MFLNIKDTLTVVAGLLQDGLCWFQQFHFRRARLIPMKEGREEIYSTAITMWNYSPVIPSNSVQSPPNQIRL